MQFGKPMREECIAHNADGTYTVKGGGWFWVRFNVQGHIVELAPGMDKTKAARLFKQEARLTLEKYGKIPVLR